MSHSASDFGFLKGQVDITELLAGVEKGERDVAAIKIATWCRVIGKSEEEAFEILKAANARNKPPMGLKVT